MPVALVLSPPPQLSSLAVQVMHICTACNDSCGMRTGNEASARRSTTCLQGKRLMTALSVMMVHDPRLRWVSDVKYLGREHHQ